MTETRVCQNCKQPFTIEPDDFAFYEKIAVPPPTFCPECRMQRRLAWRNERALFRNKCAATGKSLIAGFHPDSGVVVYERDYWWSDAWAALSFGQDYDFSKPFFTQFSELLKKVPMPHVFNARTTNVFYANYAGEYKDGYMVSASWEGENVCYAARANSTKDSADVFSVLNCSLCYEAVHSEKMYNTRFSWDSENCTDSWFLYGCRGSTNCFGCTNLRNKSYYIFNEPYSREDYLAKIKELNPASYQSLEEAREKFDALKLAAVRKFANNYNCQNVTGDHISNSANCKECFDVFDSVKDCKYLINALRMTDSYDGYGTGEKAELLYEAFDSGVAGMRQCFVRTVYGGGNIFYSLNCHGCNNLFGCIGLRNKEYCIFNKQYAKEEFENLRGKIIAHMSEMPYADKKGRWYKFGEFFPVELSPFAYNETAAQDFFPLTAGEAVEKGYPWRETERGNYEITVQAADLPDDITEVGEKVLDDIIACASCGRAYRIIAQELQLLQRMGVPLPRLCPECRHRRRFQSVNPPRLWHRKCACLSSETSEKESVYRNTAQHFHGTLPCPNEFETSYAPERPEIVYCENCYNAEVV